jgi:magnesium transporter
LSRSSRSPSRSHRQRIGLPPGSVVYHGEAPAEPVQIHLVSYSADHVESSDHVALETALSHRDRPARSWIHVSGIHDPERIGRIGTHFGLHPLLQEDIVHTSQRPKVEVYDDMVYVVLQTLTLPSPSGTDRSGGDTPPPVQPLRAEQVSLVVGPTWVLSFQERPDPLFAPVRERLRHGRGRIRTQGPDYLAYALVDVVVDSYFLVLEHLGNRIEALEDEVLDDPSPDVQATINETRRDLVSMRRQTWPVRDVLARLERLDTPVWSDDLRPFVRDAYDHAVQVLDLVESQRDIVSGLSDLSMTALSNRMNEIMKVLTIIGTIFLPLTFIAGIYGMNFEYMPELQIWWMYPLVWVLMIGGAAGLLGFFRRKGWL